MNINVTSKILLKPTQEQAQLLLETVRAFAKACNHISDIAFNERCLNQSILHKLTYLVVRADTGLSAQVTCSAIRHVIGNYRTILANQGEWIKPNYKHTVYTLLWNRDYSLKPNAFSVWTLAGRIKLPYASQGMSQYFDGTWQFGAAKVVSKHGKWFLHIGMSKDFPQLAEADVANVVGVDLGINFLATTYDSKGKTKFYNGKHIKHKRARYKQLRKELQQRQTPSARRRLKAIGSRENRWMQCINHTVSKALVESQPAKTLFVIEDLTGIRSATERVRRKDRYVQVSWAFYDLRQKIEYKALMRHSKTVAVEPKHTSQTCPKCGHTAKANRSKCKHIFICKNCCYQSNDDRVAAMNLHRKGIEYLSAVTAE